MIDTWDAPLPGDKTSKELLLSFDRDRTNRVLVLPAWFDEANKLRRLTVELMRRLDNAGIDGFLPDLPGCNESLQPLQEQTIGGWRKMAQMAAREFRATHIFAIRAGALVAPRDLPGWRYAPQSGPKTLRAMIRAQVISEQEAGRESTSEALLQAGREKGLVLAGWPIGASMVREIEDAQIDEVEGQGDIAQPAIGGAGLWLRAEPDFDTAQADALAAIVSAELGDNV